MIDDKGSKDLHDQAMAHADRGMKLRREGRPEEALQEFTAAFQMEVRAAQMLPPDLQPGHGVLHRSAATLALDAELYPEAHAIACKGLEADPIDSVREELERLKLVATNLERSCS